MLTVFKEQDSHTKDFAGHGKIFLHALCTGGRVSYGVNHINRLLESEPNIDSLFERMIILMDALQIQDPEVFDKYKHSWEEYPEKYKLLVEGLSNGALNVIRSIDVSKVAKMEPADLGPRFVERLLQDRAQLAQQPVMTVATPEVEQFEMV